MSCCGKVISVGVTMHPYIMMIKAMKLIIIKSAHFAEHITLNTVKDQRTRTRDVRSCTCYRLSKTEELR